MIDACDDCLRRAALLASLGATIDVQWRTRSARAGVLGLPDDVLLGLARGEEARRRHAAFSAARARRRLEEGRLGAVCRCRAGYPEALRDLPDPPAVLHVAGDPAALAAGDAVAVVGARRASPYGLAVAEGLGRGLSAAGLPVVSGLALGVDSAAHLGALRGATPTVAVLAGGADVPYPASKRRLYGAILAGGCAVSEMPPGFAAFRWCFPARNRIIAALSRVTVAVEAAERSGSLITADFASDLGRVVGAVPGQVTSRLAAGTNALIAGGAAVVRDARDVLDLLGADGPPRGGGPAADPRGEVPAPLRALLDAVEQGRGSVSELASTMDAARAAARGLSELEVAGWVRRDFGGRYVRVP